MIIDGHCHLDPELPPAGLVRVMDDGGIDKAVLIAAAQGPVGRVPRAGAALFRSALRFPPARMAMYRAAARSRRVTPLVRPDNRAVFTAAKQFPDRFIPFVFLNPRFQAFAYEGLERAIAGEFRGVKLHPWLHGYRLPAAAPLLERIERAGLPVIVHLGTGPAKDVEDALDLFPRLKLILAHAGIPHFERVWGLERIHFDVAAAGMISDRTIGRLVDAVGSERVIYGSDAPIGIRAPGGGHRYRIPDLPEPALAANLLSLLP